MPTKPIKKKTYPLNPMCERFPQMPPLELAELALDIERNGQIEPCQLDAEGRILDGRNRQTAWLAAITVKPLKVVKWKGKADNERYLQFVLSRNLHRRHQPMTAAQRAQLVVSLNDEFLSKTGKPATKTALAIAPEGSNSATVAELKTTEKLAKEADVSVKTMTNARRVHDAGPEIEQAVISGKMTQREALRPNRPTATQDMHDEPPEDESFMYDVFGNKMPQHCRDDFANVTLLLDWKSVVDGLRRDITKACEDQLSIARFVRLQGLSADLKNAAAALRFALPYCLCPYCAGDAAKCKACEKAGWMPKQLYEQIVPAEMKWKGDKTK